MPANDMASRKLCLFLRAFQRAMQKATDMMIEVESAVADVWVHVLVIVIRVTVQDAVNSAHIKAARILSLVNRASARCPASEI